jgi:hypothetical protein
MSEKTTQSMAKWAYIAAFGARLGGMVASFFLKDKNVQKASTISQQTGDAFDQVGTIVSGDTPHE